MNDGMVETAKRLQIANVLSSGIESIALSSWLGGSMGYGRFFSVTKDSDIDRVVVCEPGKVESLTNTPYFQGRIDEKVVDLFKQAKIDLFWDSQTFQGVAVNSFVYNPASLLDFLSLKNSLEGYLERAPFDKQEGFGFDGLPITSQRKVRSFGRGFLYEKFPLEKGRFWAPSPCCDFLVASYPLFDHHGFYDKAFKATWDATIKQLVKEHGPEVDTEKFNVLNTSYIYQKTPERIPASVKRKIVRKSNRHLVALRKKK